MNIAEKINEDFLTTYKGGDKETAETLKMIKAAFEYSQKETGKELDENAVIAVLRKEVKKRKDAAEQFATGGRADLAKKEKKEIAIIQKYLPPEISAEELETKVKAIIAKMNATAADFGKVMGEAMKELKGQADGGQIVGIVKKHLK